MLIFVIICMYLNCSKTLRKNESSSSPDWTHKAMYWSAFPLSRVISPRATHPSRLQSGMMTFQTQCTGCPQFPWVHLWIRRLHLSQFILFCNWNTSSCTFLREDARKENYLIVTYLDWYLPQDGNLSLFRNLKTLLCYVLAYSGAIETHVLNANNLEPWSATPGSLILTITSRWLSSFLFGRCLPEFMCSVHERGGK